MGTNPAATANSLTPGSDAEEHTGPSPSSHTPFLANRSAPRSCHNCNQKKIRCDKKEPCSPCVRVGKPCAYPLAGPRVRRTKQNIISDMAFRIASLEAALAKAKDRESSSRTVSVGTGSTPPSPRPTTVEQQPCNLRARPREEVLLQKGSSSQYFNETLLSRVIEDEHNIRSALTNPLAETLQQPTSSLFNPMGILSSPSPSTEPASFHPSPAVASRLWNMYLNNVEGWTTLKLTHVPTDEATVYSVINNPAKASYEDLALNYAVYFTSTVAVDVTEAEVTLGQTRESLLLQCKTGLEQSFAHGDLLGRPTINCIRALVIYLSALRVHNRSKGIWILNGLAIRIAQSLGLHRDGACLGLPPFQAEIRRRVWWQLLHRERRAGEDYGLENISCQQLLASDVRLPLNIEDADIYPEIQQLPNPKKGWTAMTLSLVNIDIARTMQKLATVVASSSPLNPPSEEKRTQLIKEVETLVESRLESSNPVIPRQRLTISCSLCMLRKLAFTTKIQWIILQRPGAHVDFVTEENLIEALDILETKLPSSEDGLLKQFAWTSKAYPQYYITMYIILHLCVKPDSPSGGRAWAAVETMTALELQDEFSAGHGSKSAVLVALKAKAMSVREKIQRQAPNENARNADHDVGSAPGEVSAGGEDHTSYQTGDTGNYNFGVDDLNEWPPWNMFVQGFQLDDPGVLWQ